MKRRVGMATVAAWLTSGALRRPWLTVWVAVGVAALGLGVAASRLELKTSNLDLIDPALPEVRRFLAFSEQFGTPNVLIVGLEGEAPDRLREAVDQVGQALASTPGVRRVDYRLPYNPEALGWHGLSPYFVSPDGTLALVFVQPFDAHARASRLAPMIEEVKRRIASLDLARAGIQASTTGLPQYAIDDRDTIRSDVSRLSIAAFVAILALFAGAFGAFLRPMAAMAVLALSVAATLGGVAFYPGHLTLVSAFFASILFGLGVDFGIHFIDRFEERLAEGVPPRDALLEAAVRLATPLTLGAATTASAFLSLSFCGFRGFAELGVVAAAGILVCLLATFVVLPPLLLVAGAGRGRERALGERRLGGWLAGLGRPAALPLVGLAVAAAFGLPRFDGDYLALQPAGSPAVRLEREIVTRSGWSPQFAAFTADSREAVWDLVSLLEAEETVGEVRSVLDLDRLRYLGVVSEAEESAFRSHFESPEGRLAIYAYPSGDVWDADFQRLFLERMRALDPQVTGMPFLGDFMVQRSRRALTRGAAVAAAAVLAWLWVGFRRWLPALLALLPAVLGAAATAALMRWTGMELNPINVMAFPVFLGIAVDDGVHLVHRYLSERGDLVRTLAGSGRSVVLTSVTSAVAFGALALGRHRGLSSLGATLALGVLVALMVSVLVLPRALTIWRRRLLEAPGARKVRSMGAAAGGLVLVVPLLVPGPGAAQSTGAEAERSGDRAWSRRAEGFVETGEVESAAVAEAVRDYRRAIELEPARLEPRFKWMEALYFEGEFTPAAVGRRHDLYTLLRDFSEETVGLAGESGPQAARAHFWAAISWGLWALNSSRWAAAAQGAAARIRDHAQRVVELDERFADGGGLRLLGRLHCAMPRVPLVTGWVDREQGIAWLQRALAVSDEDPRNRLFLAEALLDHDRSRRCEAIGMLREVASRRPAADHLVEQAAVLEEARARLRREEHRGECR